MPEGHELLDDDEKHLASLGYTQELNRSWSGFSNFAISFSIISILAGCFTSFGLGWNNGGPAAIAWGWPIVSAFILVIGLCMSELVSAYPTSGGIYWWASKLGGTKAGYYTGWLNLIGLIAILASVAYGCATFLDLTLGTFGETLARRLQPDADVRHLRGHPGDLGDHQHLLVSHLLAVINNISVWWHVAGAAIVILILFLIPEHHASFSDVFATTMNNTGMFGGDKGLGWLIFVLPISAILTQYTITGYDASAHLSEETKSAANGAAKGIWRSIFYSAIGGWILLLAFLFAVQDVDGVTKGGGAVAVIFTQAMGSKWVATVLLISTAGQLFCTTACQTSASRMLFAFSRDRAVPGHQLWSKVTQAQDPRQRRHRDAVHRRTHHTARARAGRHRRSARAGRVLRGGVHRRRRPVSGLRGADLLPLEGRRRFRGRQVEPAWTPQVDGAGCRDRDHRHLDHRAVPDVGRRRAVDPTASSGSTSTTPQFSSGPC